MIFAFLTLLSALSLATVAGWFSIIGIITIYAGTPLHALIMGVVLECGKLVTTSWLYRNWEYSSLALKAPLIIFTLTLMLTTSIGVFGFLSKSHLEQNSSTIDNGGKIERLDQQISREKSTIADSDKVISQLDATINSYIGKDRADRAVTIRRSQASQRKELRNNIEIAQKKIDEYSDEKLKLESEVRKLQLEVGPIRYIAELIHGNEDNTGKNIESAVKIFTLIIVLTLDPLAVILLIAANQTLMNLKNKNINVEESVEKEIIKDELLEETVIEPSQEEVSEEVHTKDELTEEVFNEELPEDKIFWDDINTELNEQITPTAIVDASSDIDQQIIELTEPVQINKDLHNVNDHLIKGIIGTFSVPMPKNASIILPEEDKGELNKLSEQVTNDNYPKSLSWLNEFKRS